MNNIVRILIGLMFINIYSQKEVVGKIIDKDTKSMISYVNIGIKNKGVGTVSNESGLFNLVLTENISSNDMIVFSHLGYKTKKYSVSSLLKGENFIELIPSITNLEEVIVKFKEPKAKKIGRKRKGFGLMHANFYTADENKVDDRLSKEMGMIFNLKSSCKIEGLQFNITSNEFKYLKFRVNFYDIKNKVPNQLINSKEIFFEINDGYLGWYEVDLKDADIYLNEDLEQVGVTIQWLESIKASKTSKYFSISTAVSTRKRFIQREKSMDEWFNIKANLSFYLKASCERK